jgi:hypothetical protein
MDERYDDPFGAALAGLWAARDDTGGAWVKRAPDAEVLAATGLFGEPVCRTDTQRATRTTDVVIGVENTRATTLSWPEDARWRFTQEMRDCLGSATEAHLTMRTVVTMAPVLAPA